MLNSKWIRSLNLVVPITTAILLLGVLGASFSPSGNIWSTGLTWAIVFAILNIIIAIINYRYKY